MGQSLSDRFERHDLDGRHDFYTGALPGPLVPAAGQSINCSA
jgi:hypothetical protein